MVLAVYACVHQLISQEFITEFIAKSWQKLIDFQALQKLDTGVKYIFRKLITEECNGNLALCCGMVFYFKVQVF